MAIDLSVLKTELLNDPKTLGLSTLNDSLAAKKLNEIGASNETVNVTNITPSQAQAAVNVVQFSALSASKQRLWLAIVGLPEIRIIDGNIRAQMIAIWPAGSTRTALSNLQTRSASRTEVLFGEGQSVNQSDVQKARES